MHIPYCEGPVLKFSGKRQQPNIYNTYLPTLTWVFNLRPPVPEADALQLELS